jgi:hypothetical protein
LIVGGERRTLRAERRPTVPAVVVELLADEPVHDGVHVLPEVDAQRDGQAVDARLDLAGEERLAALLPAAVVPDQRDGLAHPLAARVDAERAQHGERGRRRGPGLRILAELERIGRAVPLGLLDVLGLVSPGGILRRDKAWLPADLPEREEFDLGRDAVALERAL